MRYNQRSPGFQFRFKRFVSAPLLAANLFLTVLSLVVEVKPVQAQHPENRIEVMHFYTASDLLTNQLKTDLSSELKERQGLQIVKVAENRRARQTLNNWRTVAQKIVGLAEQADKVDALHKAYDLLAKEEFDQALNQIDRFDAGSSSCNITAHTVRSALSRPKIEYSVTIEVKPERERPRPSSDPSRPGKPSLPPRAKPQILKPIKNDVSHTVEGYRGPRLNSQQVDSIVRLCKLLNGGSERKFRLGVLRAECHLGNGDYEAATDLYDRLLDDGSIGKTRKKFIAIQSARAHLTWGNLYFREARGATNQTEKRERAINTYEQALRLIRRNFPNSPTIEEIDDQKEVLHNLKRQALRKPKVAIPSSLSVGNRRSARSSSDNPLVVEIANHANMQMMKIDAGLNFLGYSDAYIPVQRFETLLNQAKVNANQAKNAESSYISFKQTAENQAFQRLDLSHSEEIMEKRTEIAEARKQIVNEKVKQADLRIQSIDEKIKAMESERLLGGVGGVVSSGIVVGAAALFPPASVGAGEAAASAAAGQSGNIIGPVVNYMASAHKLESLKYEKRVANVDKTIALREKLIADLEIEMLGKQADFVQEKIEFLDTRELNHDVYYALAKTLKRMQQAYLESGIRMGYLAERALAFEISDPDLTVIDFDYGQPGTEGLLAGQKLLQDVTELGNKETLEPEISGKRQEVTTLISLREKYPIEFSRFIESGQMDFVTGLYDFDKAHPGTYHRRIKEVEVAIQGTIGPEGFKGELTNFGSFMVREREGTLASQRLIPTTEQIDEAFSELEAAGSFATSVGGVNVFSTRRETLILSKFDRREDGIIFGRNEETLGIFEGFGVSGLWRLELPKNLNDVDYRTIADIQITLHFYANHDGQLEPKVEELVQAYEAELSEGQKLDRISAFSLRRHFPDAFFGFTDGEIEFELLNGDFPLTMTDKQVKKIVVQAIDENGDGVDGLPLLVANSDESLVQAKTTVTNGYTENLNTESISVLPASQRVPVVDTWRIEVLNPNQIDEIDDLRVFFMYAYEERT